MKKLYFSALFFCLCVCLYAQKNSEPLVIDLLKYIGNYINNNLTKDLRYKPDIINADSIIFFGWSNNGRTAYTSKIPAGNSGKTETITEAVIFDFVNDAVLWKGKIDADNYLNKNYELDERKYNTAYNNFIADFKNRCIKYNIQFLQNDFKNLPITHNGNKINITVNAAERKNWDPINGEEFWRRFDSYTVIADSNGKRKTIRQENKPNGRAIIPCGYFLSPFEERALIVLANFNFAMESESNVSFTFIGCDLSSGFK